MNAIEKTEHTMQKLLEKLNFQDGLIPAVIADREGNVLTLCYMDEEALRRTVESGQVHVFRRSRGRVMPKGGTSGHTQRVVEMRVDCADNSLLVVVEQKVAACHAGYYTCYYRRYDAQEDVLRVCEERVFDPEDVYGE
jgi:phosphoribosyl-AMP cyclohydrolase